MNELSFDSLIGLTRNNKCRIGIGHDKNTSISYDLDEIFNPSKTISVSSYSSPAKLVEDLFDDKLDAVVRGNFPSKDFIETIKRLSGQNSISRMALLKSAFNKYFFLAPVGIDEGRTRDDKITIVKNASKLIENLDLKCKIAVLSYGRRDDLGRDPAVDKSIKEAEILNNRFLEMGLDSKDFGVLIEDAIVESNLVIVPNGMIGNYIFRTLYHLGKGDSLGAPVLNIPKIIIDTSRTKKNYSSAIVLAAALFNSQK